MDALDLLFRRIVLAARAADALSRPLDVGELMEKLVPYRAARRDGLLETNDDYLHALMRLLAGERQYIFADELLQDDLKHELASSNPDLGLLRTYTNATIRLSTTAVKEILSGDTAIDLRPPTPIATPAVSLLFEAVGGATPASVPASAPATARVSEKVSASVVAATTPGGTAPAATAEPITAPRVSASAGTQPRGCPYCAQPLPDDRAITYCPSCGLNLRIRRCAGCSAEIESGWKFCVTCGRSAS
jgi:hypothetical protein